MSEAKKKPDSGVQPVEGEYYKSSFINDQKMLATNNGPKFGARHVQMLLLSLGLIIAIGTRSNFSVAIVAMTDNTTSINPNIPTYEWDNTSLLLSSFFWSYISLQIVAGYLGKKYGPKYFLLVSFFFNCCASALIPLAAAKIGYTGVLICRIMQGLGQTFLFPSVNVLLGTWVPEQERTTLCNFAYAGDSIGSIFASIMTGYVSASWWGWPASFYILFMMGTCWCIIWLFFGHNSPASHPSINAKEKYYIESSLKQEDNVHIPVPWKKIFTSVPVYALLIVQTGNVWGYQILMTETPTYLAHAMDFDVKSNSLVNAIPSAVALACNLILGLFSDWVIARNFLTIENARKIFTLIGNCGLAFCQIWLSFLQPSQASWSVFVLGLGNALGAFNMVGSTITPMDLSPRFAGVIFGIINTTAMTVALLGPISANWIVTDLTSVAQWQCVFLIAAGFLLAGGTIFFFFGSASRQSWDGPETLKKEKVERKVSVVSFMSY